MRYFTYLLICIFSSLLGLSAAEPAAASSRPAPRKPFVAKGGKTAPRPSSSSLQANVHAPATAEPQVKSGQAEIVTIIRSHKPPSVRPALDPQNTPVVPTTESTTTVGTGANAQVGRIIDRK